MEDIEDRDEQVRISREESKQGDRERITIERTRRVRKMIEDPKGRMTSKDMTRLARRMIGGGSQSQSQSSLGLSQLQSQESSMDMGDSQKIEEEEEEEERTAPAATPKRRRGPGQTIVIETSSKKQKGGQQQQQQQQRGATAKRAESFGRYIHKVQQQVHPGLRMSKKTVSILDSMVVDVYSRLLAESRRLLAASKKKTLTSRNVHTAVRLCLPGELSKHAVSEGQKAVTMSA